MKQSDLSTCVKKTSGFVETGDQSFVVLRSMLGAIGIS